MIQHALGRYWAYASDYEVASCRTLGQLSAMQRVHTAPGAQACPEPLQNGKTAGFDYEEKRGLVVTKRSSTQAKYSYSSAYSTRMSARSFRAEG